MFTDYLPLAQATGILLDACGSLSSAGALSVPDTAMPFPWAAIDDERGIERPSVDTVLGDKGWFHDRGDTWSLPCSERSEILCRNRYAPK